MTDPKHTNTLMMWRGKDVTKMTKEQLIDIIKQQARLMELQSLDHQQALKTLGGSDE